MCLRFDLWGSVKNGENSFICVRTQAAFLQFHTLPSSPVVVTSLWNGGGGGSSLETLRFFRSNFSKCNKLRGCFFFVDASHSRIVQKWFLLFIDHLAEALIYAATKKHWINSWEREKKTPQNSCSRKKGYKWILISTTCTPEGSGKMLHFILQQQQQQQKDEKKKKRSYTRHHYRGGAVARTQHDVAHILKGQRAIKRRHKGRISHRAGFYNPGDGGDVEGRWRGKA